MPASAPAADRLSVDSAMRIAMWVWLGLLSAPFVGFIIVVWRLMDSDTSAPNDRLGQVWFIGSMIYLGLAVPLAFFWRGRLFKGYWSGQCVPPREYLLGMIIIWLALEIGGLLALAGCFISGALLPNILPALVAFMLFTPLWPTGNAMTCPPHNEQDPAHYEEPR